MAAQFLQHLQRHDVPLRVPRAGAVVWDDEALHAAAYGTDPQRYALAALVPGVPVAQRARVLLQLLTSSWAGHDGQLGALFFVGDRLAGAEIAPDPQYFAEVWIRRNRRRCGLHRCVSCG